MNIKVISNSSQTGKKIITLFGTVLAMLIFGNAAYEFKELIVPAKSILESFFLQRTVKQSLQPKDNPLNITSCEDTTSIKF
jgi:hypothetical protein